MKICVYAITKNESKHVKRWYESMKEADEIYVLDTGSTDDTVQKLKDLGVHVVTKVIKPWRFDKARNESLNLVPSDTDLYVCTDLDEVFDKGWRKLIEDNIKENTTRVKYLYNWSFKEDGVTPATTFYLDKIHTKGYHWNHPVHEVLYPEGNECFQLIEGIVLNHHPDYSKSRGSYLPLLELSVEEDPDDDRNVHYLGREYMYYNRNEDAIKMLHKHLKLPRATWKDERCASMRYMARCYHRLGFDEEAEMWFKKAEEEAPYLRESYIELAGLYNELKMPEKVLEELDKAFKIKDKSESYLNEEFAWDSYPYDLYAINAYNLGKYKQAVLYNQKAMELNPNDERLKGNQKYYEEALKKANE